VYLCYIDESGDPGPGGSAYLLLGAAALFEGKWRSLDHDLDELIRKYFPNTSLRPTEIHLASLRSGKKEYRSLTRQQRSELLSDYIDILTQLLPTEIRLFSVIAEKAWWFSKNPGKTGDDLYMELFEDLSSRFDLFLRRRYAENAPSKGMIIADPHKQALTSAIKKNHRAFQRRGTRWGQLHNLIETVFFLPSHESPGLQLADLCSYAVWRLVAANDPSIASKISDLFDREPLTSTRNPGRWHGIKLLGSSAQLQLNQVWPGI
jgi:hypothetical protein